MNRPWRLSISILAFFLALRPISGAESGVRQEVQTLRNEWEHVFYQLPEDEQGARMKALLTRARSLVQHHPKAAEPLIMEALVLCGLAGHDGGFGALGWVKEAKEVLLKAIKLDPRALDGSALVILGNLYYRLPGWPLSFGDDKQARRYLEAALKLFPEELDTNYFYGDFLLEQGNFTEALPYLEKADKAPVRANSQLSDRKLKQELKHALEDARQRNTGRSSFFSQFLSVFSQESTPH